MHISKFFFELPNTLIAHYPLADRSACRLLCLDGNSGAVSHGIFTDLLQQLRAGDLLVLNNTQVIPARLLGHKASGGQIEVLVERLLEDHQVLAHIRASHAPKLGGSLTLGDDGRERVPATVLARHSGLFRLQLHDPRPLLSILQAIGHIPLPPYIKRPDTEEDRATYQTLYARVPGAVAAPTAGLHFDQSLLAALQAKGVQIAFVTLHVGAGTFQPLRVEQIQDHIMHAEIVVLADNLVEAVLACKARGNRVVAVGTTAVRALESAAIAAKQQDKHRLIAPFYGETKLFIYPGYQFHLVDLLITNFHLPHSTLLMLVCAFAGRRNTLQAYQMAVAESYRFFSYGDAMFITRKQ